jgi:SOS response regulatory protein OraA/RecX
VNLFAEGMVPIELDMNVQKGLGNHLIDELFFEESVEKNERAMCEKVLAKKIKMVSTKKDSEKRKALLHRFLLSRGFSRSHYFRSDRKMSSVMKKTFHYIQKYCHLISI